MRFIGILREFLESSTIHGLVYISTAKVGVRDWTSLHLAIFRRKPEN
jgi:hypothetical protein